MALLTEADRAEIWQEQMAHGRLKGMTKADFKAAVDALDAYLTAHDQEMNAALPQPARSAMTTSDKARLLSGITLRRYTKDV